MLGAEETILFGNGICLMMIPKSAVNSIPIKMEPGILDATKITVKIIPNIDTHVSGLLKDPNFTKVELLLTISFELCKPIKAMNRPIPDEMAYLRS